MDEKRLTEERVREIVREEMEEVFRYQRDLIRRKVEEAGRPSPQATHASQVS